MPLLFKFKKIQVRLFHALQTASFVNKYTFSIFCCCDLPCLLKSWLWQSLWFLNLYM